MRWRGGDDVAGVAARRGLVEDRVVEYCPLQRPHEPCQRLRDLATGVVVGLVPLKSHK